MTRPSAGTVRSPRAGTWIPLLETESRRLERTDDRCMAGLSGATPGAMAGEEEGRGVAGIRGAIRSAMAGGSRAGNGGGGDRLEGGAAGRRGTEGGPRRRGEGGREESSWVRSACCF